MMRRRLTVYIGFLIAGIAAGYFIIEKFKLLSGLGFFIGMGIMAILFIPKEERSKCFCALIIGFVLLGGYYAYYESAKPSEFIKSARVISISDKGDYTRLIVKDMNKGRKYVVDADDDLPLNPSVQIGQVLDIEAETKEIRATDNPGCFDYRLYMRSLGISSAYKARHIVIVDLGDEILWKFRRKLLASRDLFLNSFDEETGAILRGVIFGDKSEIDDEIIKEFNINSSGHILAVSGLHIGFLYSLLKLLSRDRKSWRASLIIIGILIIYGEMTQWSSSTVRAVIVMGISLLSVNLRREFDLLSSLATAALLILVFRPYMLFNAGFQLSFAAMGSIAFISRRISGYIGYMLGAALSVQMGTMPLIAMSFMRVNLMSFLINIPIIILSSLIVPLCILGLMLFMAIGCLPGFFINAIELFAELLVWVNHILSFNGAYSNLAAGVTPIIILAFYAMIIIVFSEWTRVNLIRKNYGEIKKLIAYMILPAIMCFFSVYDSFSDDEIVFIAVGQGDAVHISSGNKNILIDGGGSDYMNVGERILMPYLLSHGTSSLDMALVTHLHMDHFQGIRELSLEYPIDTLGIPSDYAVGDFSGIRVPELLFINGENNIQINDDVSISVLWPLKIKQRRLEIDDPNEHNMVYMINYKGVRIMVTGDLLAEDEEKMIRHYIGTDALKCDILKVAHHGSKSSSSEEFLDAASPEFAIIQVGRNNIYGHPHDETVNRIEERGIKTYRTDKDGAVGVDIGENKSIKIHTMH